MAYDAGPGFDPIGTLECYKIYYKGPLHLGMEVGIQAWGGALIGSEVAKRWMQQVVARGSEYGIFVWSWQKGTDGKTPSAYDLVVLASKIS